MFEILKFLKTKFSDFQVEICTLPNCENFDGCKVAFENPVRRLFFCLDGLTLTKQILTFSKIANSGGNGLEFLENQLF